MIRHGLSLSMAIVLVACVTPIPVVPAPPEPIRGMPLPESLPKTASESLRLCRVGGISNAPAADGEGRIIDYAPRIEVRKGLILAVAPAENVCLNSGFGFRRGRPHEGIDLVARPASSVFAAGDGQVLEITEANGYGLYVLIDHGRGVYTRYAHLNRTEPRLRVGTPIAAGTPIGIMGRSGNATGIHLHYEILTGNYRNPRRSFGLMANDPFAFPAAIGARPNIALTADHTGL